MSQPSSITCGDRSGFLFAHACDRLATGQCVQCAKPICVEHTRITETGPTCITCLRSAVRDRDDDSSGRDRDTSSSTTDDTAPDPGPAPGGGEFGGAGAQDTWSAEPPAYAKADDPYFFPGPAEAAAYDADDLGAFDGVAATADDPGHDTDAIETDTGAS